VLEQVLITEKLFTVCKITHEVQRPEGVYGAKDCPGQNRVTCLYFRLYFCHVAALSVITVSIQFIFVFGPENSIRQLLTVVTSGTSFPESFLLLQQRQRVV